MDTVCYRLYTPAIGIYPNAPRKGTRVNPMVGCKDSHFPVSKNALRHRKRARVRVSLTVPESTSQITESGVSGSGFVGWGQSGILFEDFMERAVKAAA